MWPMGKNKFHEGAGPSQRQLRVGETIRRALSDVLARGDVHDPELNRLSITVGEVRTSSDLKIATAYVLPLGGQGQEDVLKLKFSPDLRFQLDQTFDQMDETRRMLSQDVVRRDAQAPDEAAPDEAADG
jgi:ribosome-binding factor A